MNRADPWRDHHLKRTLAVLPDTTLDGWTARLLIQCGADVRAGAWIETAYTLAPTTTWTGLTGSMWGREPTQQLPAWAQLIHDMGCDFAFQGAAILAIAVTRLATVQAVTRKGHQRRPGIELFVHTVDGRRAYGALALRYNRHHQLANPTLHTALVTGTPDMPRHEWTEAFWIGYRTAVAVAVEQRRVPPPPLPAIYLPTTKDTL